MEVIMAADYDELSVCAAGTMFTKAAKRCASSLQR